MSLRDRHLQKVSIEKLQELIELRKQNALLLKVLEAAEQVYAYEGNADDGYGSILSNELKESIRAYRASESEGKND